MATRTKFKVFDTSFSGVDLSGLTRSTTICEYRGNVNSSNQMVDYGANSLHLGLSGSSSGYSLVPVQDKHWNRIDTVRFNGVGNYLQSSHSDLVDVFDSNSTITAMVCFDSSTLTAEKTIISYLPAAFNTSGFLLYGHNNAIYAKYYKSGSNVSSNVTISAYNSMHIIQITRNNNSMVLTVDGYSASSVDVTGYGIDNPNNKLSIGGTNVAGAFLRLYGSVPYVRIDSECLSTNEIGFERNYLLGCHIGLPGMKSRINSVSSNNKKYWTFSRASEAYNQLNNGLLHRAAAGLQRLGNSGSMLIGAAATNLSKQSESAIGFTETQPAGAADKSWLSVDMDSDGSNIIIGSSSRLYTSNNYGVTWTERQPAGASDKTWGTVASDSDGSFLVAGSTARLWTSSDSGANWTERRPKGDDDGDWRCSACSTDGVNIVVAEYGKRLWTSTDSGATWTERRPAGDADCNWQSVDCDSDCSVIIAAVSSGRLYLSTDSGGTWSEMTPAGSANKSWFSVSCDSDGSFLIACVNGGRIYYSTNTGAAWNETRPAGDTNQNWRPVKCNSTGSICIAGIDGGAFYRSTNSCTSWTQIYPTTTGNLYWYKVGMDDTGCNIITPIYSSGRVWISHRRRNEMSSISADSTIAPNSEVTSDGEVPNSTDTDHKITEYITLTAASYTWSVYAKKGSKDWVYLSDDTVANAYAYFNISTGSAGTVGAGCTANIQPASTGYYRISITFTGTAATHSLVAQPANADGDKDYAGDGSTIACYFWGHQVGASKHFTSYIPTTSASATRNADVQYVACSTIPGLPTSISNTAHWKKLYVECEFKAYYATNALMNANHQIFELSGNTGTAGASRNRVSVYVDSSDGTIVGSFWDNSSTQHYVKTPANPFVFNSAHNKITLQIDMTDLSNMEVYINDSIATDAESGTSGTAVLDLTNCSVRTGNDYSGATNESCEIRNTKIWVGV